ncbi:Ff.00g022220.m01.CDS01 [Fusarium sp. VM40]|nr:Ff.00g022220.m01.CDS01 [Fusarium sp. VM40]
MKIHTILLSHLLLPATEASSLPKLVRAELTRRTNHKGSSTPKESTLVWSKCDLDFGNEYLNEKQKDHECARLKVPLDYTNESNGETIELDLIKVKATAKPFKGSVLYNPGGPGASGVETTVDVGSLLSEILGGQFDIISFDPRGTGRTIPFICEETNVPESGTLQQRDFNTLPQTDMWEFLQTTSWRAGSILAEKCFQTRKDIGRFVNTPFVARDMFKIVDALDQGPLLNFWGMSYGTVLGQVAVSLFPDRVGRVFFDGNKKADDYAADIGLAGLEDAERAVAHILDECVKGGKKLCSLADFHGENTTGKSLFDAFSQVIEKGLTGSKDPNLSALGIKGQIIVDLKDPANYQRIVKRIEGLLSNNAAALKALATRGAPSGKMPCWNRGGAAIRPGISCGDSSFRVDTPEDLYSMYQAHRAAASFSESTLSHRFACANWKFTAAEQIDLNKLRNVKTNFPILLANGRYDPVTSLRSAWEISARFPGSRVIVHEGAGHCVLNHRSNCTESAIKGYFVDGQMPSVNTVCKPNLPLFEYIKDETEKARKAKEQN